MLIRRWTLLSRSLIAIAVIGAVVMGRSQICAADDPVDYEANWHVLNVPGTWDEQTDGRLDEFDGIAWYRCMVTLPGGWVDKPVVVRIENIDDAYEAYWNGTKLGGAGGFPPDYSPAAADAVELAVPTEALKAGGNLVAMRIYDDQNRGGFKASAPAVLSGDDGINLNGQWEFRIGDDPAWASGSTALAKRRRLLARDAAPAGSRAGPCGDRGTLPRPTRWQPSPSQTIWKSRRCLLSRRSGSPCS